MTESQSTAVPGFTALIGPTVTMAQRVLTKLLDEVLAETGTSRQTFFALQRLAAIGGQATRDEYVADLSEALDLDPSRAGELADGLLADGLLTVTGDTIRLSETGAGLRSRVLNSAGAITGKLYEPFSQADLETMVRTLQGITARARELR